MEALANVGITWSLWFVAALWILVTINSWNVQNVNWGKVFMLYIAIPGTVVFVDFLMGK